MAALRQTVMGWHLRQVTLPDRNQIVLVVELEVHEGLTLGSCKSCDKVLVLFSLIKWPILSIITANLWYHWPNF